MVNSTLAAALAAALKTLRPPFLLLTPVCVFLGIAAALYSHPEANTALIWPVLIGALAAHGAVNSLNEYLDFHSGLDAITQKTPFSGGTGSLVETPSAARLVLIITVFLLAVTIGCGLYLVAVRGPELIPVGALGVVIIIAYTRVINRLPLLCLIAPGLAFGPLMVGGTYWVFTGTINVQLLLLTIPVFLMVNNLLLVNQLPDIEADTQIGRRTFPIVYGVKNALHVYLLFSVLSFVTGTYLCYLLELGWWSVLVLAPFVIPFISWSGLSRNQGEIPRMIPFMGLNVVANLTIPLVLGGAILFS